MRTKCGLASPLVGLVTWVTLTLATFLSAIFLVGRTASAEPTVYVNPAATPVDPGSEYPLPPDQSNITLHLYLDSGSQPEASGIPCIDGDGEHTCAYEVDLEAIGDVTFVGFSGDPGVVSELLGSDRVSAVWADPVAPMLGPQRVGILRLDTGSDSGSVRLSGGGVVVGELAWTFLEAEDLARIDAPEPGFGAALLVSVFILFTLTQRRRGRTRVLRRVAICGLVGVGLGLTDVAANAADPSIPVDARFIQMTAGLEHTCGILTSGEIECFGDDTFNQVSNAPAGAFKRLSAGDNVTCAIRQAGTLACWGPTSSGLVVPPPPPSGREFVTVSVGAFVACAVDSSREVVCWGIPQFPAPPTGPAVTEVASGVEHTCARQPNATVICWGIAGAGAATVPAHLVSQPYQYVGTGDSHTCALRGDGAVDCWGDGAFGKTAPPATLFESMSVGHHHACGVRPDGGVECWGRDDRGETAPPPGVAFASVHVGDDHTCGLKEDGSAQCWGDALAAKSMPPETVVNDVAVGDAHSCGLAFDGSIECWGSNSALQLVAPAGEFQMIDAGARHSCAIYTAGGIACWGDDGDGQSSPGVIIFPQYQRVAVGGNASCAIRETLLGRPTFPISCWGDSAYDQDRPPTGDFMELALGDRHGCAIGMTGKIQCWGDPTSKNGKTDPPSGTFVEIAAGDEHSCAITTEGTVRCWGDDRFGQSQNQSKIFTRIAAGGSHSCGILLSGRLRCWGNPSDGRTTPPPGFYEAISAGTNHTCATRVGGGFACWGLGGPDTTPVADADSDGLEDGIDNCPFVANADQADGDDDGAGDVCDVCPVFPDVDQLASYGDGVGDRCDASPRIELIPDSLNTRPTDATYDLYLDCKVSTITRITPEIVIPFFDPILVTPVPQFGDGCTGSNCIGATALGATVNAPNSFITLITSTGIIRQGTLRLSMSGSPNLCTPGQRVFIGRLRIPGVTSFAVLPKPSTTNLNDPPILGPGGLQGRPPVHSASVLDPEVVLNLVYQGNDRFVLTLEAAVQMHRVAVGIRVAPGGGPVIPISFGPLVSGTGSTILPPDPMADPPIRTDTLYLEFVGSEFDPFLPLDALNQPVEPIELMTFDHPMVNDVPPILEFEGVDEAFPGNSPFETAVGVDVPPENVGYEFFTDGADTDSDGDADEQDNCPFAYNPQQEDGGGFGGPVPNLRGDACECGDASGEGAVTSALDPTDLRDFLADKPDPAPLTSELCSVSSGIECNALDLVTLELAFEETGPGLQSVCRGAVGTSLLSGQ